MENALAGKIVLCLWMGVSKVQHAFRGQKEKAVYWDHEMVLAGKFW